MTRYFLSYSRSDEGIALRLADDLIAAGIGVWVDQYDIRPSEHWDRAVEAAVHDCTGMIVVLSPRSALSPNVADEISVAIDRKKRIIPVMIELCTVPLRMTRMQFIDATADYPLALRKCLSEIAREDGAPAPARREAVEDVWRAAQDIPRDAVQEALPPLDPAVIEAARLRLTAALGPIAAMLVKAAATRARTEGELHTALAARITAPAERTAFLADLQRASAAAGSKAAADTQAAKGAAAKGTSTAAPVAPSTAMTSDAAAPVPPMGDVNRITAALARSLGPIAARLVDRERRSAASTTDLCRRLAALVPNDRERAVFLREVERS